MSRGIDYSRLCYSNQHHSDGQYTCTIGHFLRNTFLVQAFKTGDPVDYVIVGMSGLNKKTGNNVVATLQPGQSVLIGDKARLQHHGSHQVRLC